MVDLIRRSGPLGAACVLLLFPGGHRCDAAILDACGHLSMESPYQ
jgi:hypothetical protein